MSCQYKLPLVQAGTIATKEEVKVVLTCVKRGVCQGNTFKLRIDTCASRENLAYRRPIFSGSKTSGNPVVFSEKENKVSLSEIV